MRSKVYVWGKQSIATIARNMYKNKTRLQALFLCLVIFAGAVIPTASVYAAEQAAKPKVSKPLSADQPLQFAAAADNGKQLVSDPVLNSQPEQNVQRERKYEDESKRTATTKTYVNTDGSRTLDYSIMPMHYQRDGKWVDLNAVTEADNSFRSATPLEKEPLIGNPFAKKPQSYNFSAGELGVKLHTYNDGIEFTFKGKQFKLKPAGANNVRPTVTETEEGHKIITYKEAWPGVDVDYEVHGAMLKETIVLKRPGTTNVFVSRLEGVKAKPHSKHKGALELEGINPDELFISPLTVNVNQKGLISEEVAKQTVNGNVFAITVDAQWLRSQPKDSFPIAVDPTFYHDVGGTYGLFKAYKSDGYMCESSTCDPQAGRLNDNGYKWWRTMFRIPFEELKYNKKVLGASIHLVKKQRSYWTGYDGWKSIHTSWAPCFGFNCTHDKSYQYGAGANTNDWSDVRRTVAWMSGEDNPDPQWGGWFMMWGDEGSDSYKQFEPTSLVMSVLFDTPTPMAQAIAPADKQIVVTSQPSLSINPVSDADGEAVQYYFQVSSNPDAKTGAVINSGWTKSTQWTVPDGILQDGTTYYWHAYTTGATQTDPNWVRSFKYDMRTGKDSTQAYDTVGPMSIDLATGNATTSTGTHTMSALGGSMGLSLDYNTPAKSRPGLVGEYWNNVSRDGVPGLTRVDPNIEFLWGEGTPAAGVINPDNFSARWAGYLTVPTTGNYYFGGHIDDGYNIYINEQLHHNVSGTGTFFGNTPVYLEAGKPARIRVEFYEAGGNATFRMLARGAVTEQVVPSTWLQTGIRQTSQQYGLVGRYYNDEGGSRTFPANNDDPMRLIMTRTDPKISFNWADGAPVPGAPSDRFLVRWRGYVTVPVNGAYQFGGASDDGLRMWINNQQVINDWVDRGTTQSWGAAVNLTAGQTVPVTIEYYENGGGATMNFNVKGAVPEQEVPATWLSPKALAVPEGWQIGVDVDGDISYERLRTSGANVILTDSSGQTHEYTWNESVYKAPVNEEGQLVRNANGTYTLVDTDGRTYIFDSEGKLTSVTTPQDDKQPAALKYEYAGDPSRLMKIVDGVTSSRFATLHYKSVNEEGNCTQSAGFDAAPTGMLCAFKTTDGDTTRLQYKNGRLARVEKPGNELLDYGYDTAGRIVNVRDSVANDAVGAGIRAEDATVTTEVSYDELGRVAAVKAPAAQANSNRTNHTFEYLPGTAPVFGVAQMHITGAPEPAGFSKRIEYDTLFRTIRETDAANLSSVTEWDSVKDLSLSTTDATGLKSTTIYDSEDRPIESYGPAPAAWYDTDRKPLAANSSQVPRTQTNYDEGIRGLNVSIYDNKKLLGVPKIHTTAFNNVPYVSYGVDAASGITPTDGLALRASGKILLNQTGNYSFRAWHSDGMRIYVDNQLVVDNWLDGGERWSPSGTFNNSTANRWVNYRVDVYKTGTTGRVFAHLHMTPPGSAEQTDFAHLLTPAYNLQTSQTAYDAQLGNVTSKTEYDKPEYGLVKK
ncbi:MAG: hypothetical protein JWL85_805, partial [Candidatus Saccharibacteria bacterium]|nr:hypothetical protein [Candidatus Saccharibacteria bacterium]